MRLGVINLTHSSLAAVKFAQAAEAAGFWGVGIGDTVPERYQDTYVTAAACFAATERVHIGPTVTNTVTRHWSVLGATARTFGELYPGRFFAGLATGDGACHSVGLTPSTWAKLEKDVANVRRWAPSDMEVHIATADAARISQRGRSVGTAHFSFSSTFEDKGVPEAWQPILRERLARYDFSNHGVGAGNTNGYLFDDHPDIQEYLLNRFQLLGTADECEARLRQVAADAGLDGCWFTQSPLAPDEDPIQRVRTTGEALSSLAGFEPAHVSATGAL